MSESKNNNEISIKIVQHGSDAYKETVALRFEILRKPLKLTFTEEQLASENKDYHFVLYKAGKLAACLILSPYTKDAIKMRQVAVDKELQGLGLGKLLVKFTEKWSSEQGYKSIVLHARQSAVPFYLSQNYKIIGEPFFEVGIPHRKMEKAL